MKTKIVSLDEALTVLNAANLMFDREGVTVGFVEGKGFVVTEALGDVPWIAVRA